jgi:hypothetical protein
VDHIKRSVPTRESTMNPVESIIDAYTSHLSRVARSPLSGPAAREATLAELLVRREMASELVLRVPESELPALNYEREIIEGELRLRFG